MSRRRLIAASAAILASPAAFATCRVPALGPARVLPTGTTGGFQVGLRTYPQTLALGPREVVLTFDDGPAPGTTPAVLDALACEGVHATFFMIGRNAAAHPALVQRVAQGGHTLACHSLTHPWTMRELDVPRAIREAEEGFAAIRAAAGPQAARLAPFFRFPGFADTAEVNAWLAQRDMGVFGCDLWASDWVMMTPEKQLSLTLARLDHEGGGIILFHDTQPQTAAMLPAFLRSLAERGYRVVHLEPGPGRAPLRAAPAGWSSETEAIISKNRARRG